MFTGPRFRSPLFNGCSVAAGFQPKLDDTPECRHVRHSKLPEGWDVVSKPDRVTRFTASSCLVDLPAASIPIGPRKDPCSDSAGRKHPRLSCLSVESALHVPEGKLYRRVWRVAHAGCGW